MNGMAQPMDAEWLGDLQIVRSDPLPGQPAKLAVGYVYFIRHGSLDEFKIGMTTNIEQRLKTLQTGSPRKLKLFEFIETSDARAGETYVHDLLKDRRLVGENFALSPAEARAAAARTRNYVDDELPRLQAVRDLLAELKSAESTGQLLPSTDAVRAMHQRLLELDEDIAARNQELETLGAERRRLEDSVKLAIGVARGIEGVATWETTDGRRRINPSLIKSDDPDLYEEYVRYVEQFDTPRFKREMPEVHASYQVTRRVRVFQLVRPRFGGTRRKDHTDDSL